MGCTASRENNKLFIQNQNRKQNRTFSLSSTFKTRRKNYQHHQVQSNASTNADNGSCLDTTSISLDLKHSIQTKHSLENKQLDRSSTPQLLKRKTRDSKIYRTFAALVGPFKLQYHIKSKSSHCLQRLRSNNVDLDANHTSIDPQSITQRSSAILHKDRHKISEEYIENERLTISPLIFKKKCIDHFYEIQSLLGRGSFGEVYKCKHRVTCQEFAIKIMEKTVNSSQSKKSLNLSKMFKNEVNILSELNHPNVVQLKEVYEDESKFYAVLEYCDSGDLYDFILQCVMEQRKLRKMLLAEYKANMENEFHNIDLLSTLLRRYKGPCKETDIVSLVRAMLQSLNYIHSKRYAHRDIKAQSFLFSSNNNQAKKFEQFKTSRTFLNTKSMDETNISLDSKTTVSNTTSYTGPENSFSLNNKRVVLIDFGMSAYVPPGDYLNTICGTSHYVAPEILSHKYGFEVDMWALGIILYIMLYGRLPFDDVDRNAILNKIKNYSVAFPISSEGPSFWALNFLQRCLARDPKQRISAAEALQHSWLQPGVANDRYCYPIVLIPTLKRPLISPRVNCHDSKSLLLL